MSYYEVGTYKDLRHLNGGRVRPVAKPVRSATKRTVGTYVRFIDVLADVSRPVKIAVG